MLEISPDLIIFLRGSAFTLKHCQHSAREEEEEERKTSNGSGGEKGEGKAQGGKGSLYSKKSLLYLSSAQEMGVKPIEYGLPPF